MENYLKNVDLDTLSTEEQIYLHNAICAAEQSKRSIEDIQAAIAETLADLKRERENIAKLNADIAEAEAEVERLQVEWEIAEANRITAVDEARIANEELEEVKKIMNEITENIERINHKMAAEDELTELEQNVRETIEMYNDVIAVIPNYNSLEEVPEFLQSITDDAMTFVEEALAGKMHEEDLANWWGTIGTLEFYEVVTLVRRGDVEYTVDPITTDIRNLLVTKASC